MSRGELMSFNVCPSRWFRGYEDKESSSSTEWGSLLDTLLLSPDAFEDRVAVYPTEYESEVKKGVFEMKEWNNNAGVCKTWKANHANKLFVKDEKNQQAHIALAVLRSDADIAAIVTTAKKQVFVLAEYHDKETGLVIPVKSLIDIVPDKSLIDFAKCLIDFKTCNSAAMRPWTTSVFNFGYHVQGALYMDSYVKATGEDRTDFLHICSESVSPYEVAKRLLSSEFLELGRVCYVRALKRYARCLAENHWPGYDEGTNDLVLNGWRVVSPIAWMLNAHNEDAYDSWTGANVPDEPEKNPQPDVLH